MLHTLRKFLAPMNTSYCFNGIVVVGILRRCPLLHFVSNLKAEEMNV